MQNYSTLNQLFNVFRTSLIKLDHSIILIEINVKFSIHAAQNTGWVIFFSPIKRRQTGLKIKPKIDKKRNLRHNNGAKIFGIQNLT